MVSNSNIYTVEELVDSGVLYKPLDGNHGGIHPKGNDFVESGIPFIMASDMLNGQVDTRNCKFISSEQANTLRKGFAVTGDVLLSHKATIGRTAIVGDIDCDFIVLTPQVTYYRIKDSERLDNRYLKYYFDSYQFQSLMNQWAGGGSTRAYLGITAQLKLPIKVINIDDQKAIAHILGTLDDKIELNRQMNETLEAMAQALFKSWFVDFDPVIDNALLAGKSIPDELAERAELRQAQLDSGEAKTNSQINDLFPSEFEFTEELGWIPKGWRVSPLPEVMDFLEGPGIRNWQYTEEEEGIKFINIRCIQNGDINLKTANKITREEAFGKYKHFQLEVDDIIMSASGTLGRYAFVRQEHLPLSLNTSVIRFRPINGVSTLYYIAGYIDTKLQWELETRASGSVQRNFGPMHLKKITMFVPDINVLEEHARLSSEIFNKRRNNLEQIDTLIQLRDTLLPKLMSGELRIPDAEKLVEDI